MCKEIWKVVKRQQREGILNRARCVQSMEVKKGMWETGSS